MRHEHLLARIFVCIAFKWDVSRLCQLKQTVTTVLNYRTRVDACIVTDKQTSLQQVLDDWDFTGNTVAVCSVNVSAFDGQYAVVWGHREAMETAVLRAPQIRML